MFWLALGRGSGTVVIKGNDSNQVGSVGGERGPPWGQRTSWLRSVRVSRSCWHFAFHIIYADRPDPHRSKVNDYLCNVVEILAVCSAFGALLMFARNTEYFSPAEYVHQSKSWWGIVEWEGVFCCKVKGVLLLPFFFFFFFIYIHTSYLNFFVMCFCCCFLDHDH